MEISVSETCRLCLSENSVCEDIFDNYSEDLPHKILIFSSIEVTLGDGYTSLICISCKANIENFWIFRLKIQHSDEVLKRNVYTALPESTKELRTVTKNKTKSFSPVPLDELFSDEQSSVDDSGSEYSYRSAFITSDSSSSTGNEEENNYEDPNYDVQHPDIVKVQKLKKRRKAYRKRSNEQCYECGKIFKSAGYLAHHMRVHSGMYRKLRLVNMKLRLQNVDECHIIKSDRCLHPVSLRPFKCEVCQKSFSQNSALVVHSRRHSGDKPYICTTCGKGFTQSGNLAVHYRSHSGEKPFQCDLCCKSFSQIGNLYIHKRIHSGVRAHSCDICQKAFKFPSHLAEHMKIHSDSKQYQCPVCNKGFHKGSYLSTHMRIHTGEKPYSCDHCRKSFSNSSNLAAHIRIHTGSKPYVCVHCNKGFAQSSAMVRHTKKHIIGDIKIPLEITTCSATNYDESKC